MGKDGFLLIFECEIIEEFLMFGMILKGILRYHLCMKLCNYRYELEILEWTFGDFWTLRNGVWEDSFCGRRCRGTGKLSLGAKGLFQNFLKMLET